MQTDKVGLPLFQVMGNHDNKVIAVSKDNYTVAHDIAAQRNFEYIFGPVNYSFDRGNVHIIAMDNIISRATRIIRSDSATTRSNGSDRI